MRETLTVGVIAPGADVLAAQRVVCSELVDACEQALFSVRCRTGEAESPADVRAGMLAAELVEQVLVDWRQALAELQGVVRDRGEPTFTARSLPLKAR